MSDPISASSAPAREISRTRRDPAPVLNYLLTQNALHHGYRLLCYGCGTGTDVQWLQLRKFETQGYDPHPPFGYSELPQGHYDVVFLNYVLTRLKGVEAQRSAVARAFSHTKPGGRFIITSRTALREAGASGASGLRTFFENLLAGCDVLQMEVLPPDPADRSVAAIVVKAGIYAPQTPWSWVDTPEELERVCTRLLREPIIGLDVETTLEEPRTLCTVQIGVPDHTYIIDALAFPQLDLLRAVMENDKIVKIIHNAAFEEQMLAKHKIRIINIFDTLPASRKKYKKTIQGGHKLGEVCERELGVYLDKTLQTSDWTLRPLSEAQLHYAAIDAEVLLMLYRIFCPPKAPENLELF